MLLGGTFGKPISLDHQNSENQQQNQSASEQDHAKLINIAGDVDGFGFGNSSRSPSPQTRDEKLPVLESNKESIFADDENKSDNLSKLVRTE